MHHTAQMLQTHPSPEVTALSDIADCIDALQECVQTCTSCADADLSESDPQMMVRCVRLNHDCADICAATARVLSRPSMVAPEIWLAQLQACVTACHACAEECEKHAQHHDHCRLCAEACRQCIQSCKDTLAMIRH